MWDPSTLQINKADVTLFQSLGAASHRRACLVLYSGAEIGRRFALDGERLVIGRASDCEIQLDNPGISRRHAEIRLTNDAVLFADLGSANGSSVNDRPVEAPAVLHDGDLLRVGNIVLRYYERENLDALLHDRIYRMATVDAGTGVYTKKYLFESLEREIGRARRSQHPLALVCLDLDHFKRVNDTHGHNAGDVVLRLAAGAAQAVVRASDIVGRIGGEEFAIILPETDAITALGLAERVRLAIAEQRYAIDGPAGTLLLTQTASLGVAAFRPAMRNGRDLLGAADACLYAAKRGGRNRVESAEPAPQAAGPESSGMAPSAS